MTGLGVDLPFAHFDPRLRQPPPCAGIGFVVLICDDNRVTGFQPFAKGLCQNIDILRGRGTKGEFVCVHAKHAGKALAGFVHLVATDLTCRKGPVGLHFAFAVEALKAFGHKTAGIRTAGAFKKRLIGQRGLFESGEKRANESGVE